MDGRRARAWLPSAALAFAGLALCVAVPLLWAAPRTSARPAAQQQQQQQQQQPFGDSAWGNPFTRDPTPAPAAATTRPAAPRAAAASAAALAGGALAAAVALGRRQRQPARGLRQRRARGGEAVECSDQESQEDACDLDGTATDDYRRLDGSFLDVLTRTDEYIEDDRRFRRPVFGYADWKRHRSADRFPRNLSTLPISTTVRANWKEIVATAAVAAAVCLWNDAEAVTSALNLGPGAVDFAKNLPELSLPALPFTLSSASLSLLLVFRTNKAYERWWEARCIWGAIINTCRDIVRQSLVRIDPADVALKEEVTRLVSAYPRSLIYHLGERTEISNKVIEQKYRRVLTDEETERLLKCTHKPMTVTGMLSNAIHRAKLPVIDEMKIDQDITKFSDYYGMCERIFKTPMPLSFTRKTSRFLSIWILALPAALYGVITPHWMIIPVTVILAFFVFGIEEIGVQIEEPFSALALNAMADGIDASIFEALELEKKDPTIIEPRGGWKQAKSEAPMVYPDHYARAVLERTFVAAPAPASPPEAPAQHSGATEAPAQPSGATEARKKVAYPDNYGRGPVLERIFGSLLAPAGETSRAGAPEASEGPGSTPKAPVVYPSSQARAMLERTPKAGKGSKPAVVHAPTPAVVATPASVTTPAILAEAGGDAAVLGCAAQEKVVLERAQQEPEVDNTAEVPEFVAAALVSGTGHQARAVLERTPDVGKGRKPVTRHTVMANGYPAYWPPHLIPPTENA